MLIILLLKLKKFMIRLIYHMIGLLELLMMIILNFVKKFLKSYMVILFLKIFMKDVIAHL